MTNKLPFTITKNDTFFDLLGDYIGDVFYDILPEKGYELRDEQIYMAFQVEQAFKNKGIVFAEAGVGTGKTFVYLIYAILYARYMGKPAIVSCSDETLIEQLVKEGGDIEKLEQALGLKVDVRLAKAREQYVCVKKLDDLSNTSDDFEILDVHDQLPDFIFDEGISMNSFSRYGDRKEYPWVTNEKWSSIAWDPLQQCSTCSWRHRCGQTLNRDYYRHAGDLIICSHDFYMEHVWTKESRKREGQMPLLPEASTVIFDEGHLLEFAAQKGLTYRFNSQTLTTVLTGYMHQDVREDSLYLIEDILELHDAWFDLLIENSSAVEGSTRKEVPMLPVIRNTAETLEKKVSELMDQLVFDAEMFLIDEYHLKIMEEYLEFFAYGLSIFLKNDEGIFWLEENEVQTSLVIMPRLVEDILKKEVFSQNIPFVFSSATLSQAGDFEYIAKSLGIEKYSSFTVASPFDYEAQMEMAVHVENDESNKWLAIGGDLRNNRGSSLVLFSSMQEMERFRSWSDNQEWEFNILFEGDREISETVKDFQNEVTAVLCSYSLWEGLDVPGESLTQVIISSLPFPPHDPVFQAKRKHAKNPNKEVDIPYMLLRLIQGMGRLIRTSQDKGAVHLWVTEKQKEDYMAAITDVLPVTDIKLK
ncbi:ATP-dependent DNA helicase [Mesobacillus subterraneus]|uniref:ATP-dependent DNA helicase n=1 Tax=Mesobacillus subterraneus TaxID=285983 RepID=A0A3R9DW90_9BACI|nr:ATP-dependent DNA helicase [Mesobacillus subterraneus]RSD28827.1 ATP-dependent DNA helicase [Mesobacillus subterraneus]